MKNLQIPIVSIRRLTIHDGPGIRDTVFVKGCPLHCIWCHNPESVSAHPQLLYHEMLCSNCGECVRLCPQNVHTFDVNGKHLLARAKCLSCGKCAENCLSDALELCGKMMSIDDVLSCVLRDRDFFTPEGGVTVSGGEPALYPEFVSTLFKRLKENGIHTALDTCGAVDFENFKEILPYTDLVLFDLKGMDVKRHRAHTGKDNLQIHDNLKKISAYGTSVEIRMPIIPGFNDFAEDIEASGVLLSQIDSLCRVQLLAYHDKAKNKYAVAGMNDTLPQTASPDIARLKETADVLLKYLPENVSVKFE